VLKVPVVHSIGWCVIDTYLVYLVAICVMFLWCCLICGNCYTACRMCHVSSEKCFAVTILSSINLLWSAVCCYLFICKFQEIWSCRKNC